MIKSVTATITDEELLRRMTTGEAEAFEQLYDRRQANVYQFALRMSGSPTLAEDITQDVFIELLRGAQQFDPTRGTVAGYLYGMTRHRVLRRLQRERTFVSMAEEEGEDAARELDERLITNYDPLDQFARGQMIEAVRQAILSLPVHYREVAVLCNLHELSYEQAAQVIGCPVGTVRSRLNRARAMLVDKLRLLQETDAAPERAARAGREL
jgi:RNA polymerase sigma-70 factor, ECF subfamily